MYLSDVLDNIGNGPITNEIIVSAAIIILSYWSGRWRVAASAASIYEIKPHVPEAYLVSRRSDAREQFAPPSGLLNRYFEFHISANRRSDRY